MVQAFGPSGLNDLDRAVRAMEVVAAARPKQYALWAQLAQLAYLAGQTRKGDLSADKAVSLAPADQRKALRQQLTGIKGQAAAAAAQQQATPAPSVTTTTG